MAVLYLVSIAVSACGPVGPGPGDGPAGLVGDERPAHHHFPSSAAALARLLHRGEGRRRHEPHDERHREPAAAAPGRPGAVRHPGSDDGRDHCRSCSPPTRGWLPSQCSPCCPLSSSCRSGSSGHPNAATSGCATASPWCWPISPRACRACVWSRRTTASATTSRPTATSWASTATPTTTPDASTGSTGRARR